MKLNSIFLVLLFVPPAYGEVANTKELRHTSGWQLRYPDCWLTDQPSQATIVGAQNVEVLPGPKCVKPLSQSGVQISTFQGAAPSTPAQRLAAQIEINTQNRIKNLRTQALLGNKKTPALITIMEINGSQLLSWQIESECNERQVSIRFGYEPTKSENAKPLEKQAIPAQLRDIVDSITCVNKK